MCNINVAVARRAERTVSDALMSVYCELVNYEQCGGMDVDAAQEALSKAQEALHEIYDELNRVPTLD